MKRIVDSVTDILLRISRTFVNIVPVPLVETVVTYEKKPLQCEILHHGECSCWVGRLYNQTKELQERYSTIQRKMQDVEEEVGSMKEFRGLKEFAVMYQPFSRRLNVTKVYGNILRKV